MNLTLRAALWELWQCTLTCKAEKIDVVSSCGFWRELALVTIVVLMEIEGKSASKECA